MGRRCPALSRDSIRPARLARMANGVEKSIELPRFELVCCPIAEEDAVSKNQCSCLCVPVGAVVALMTHGQADLGPHIHEEFIDTLSDEEYAALRYFIFQSPLYIAMENASPTFPQQMLTFITFVLVRLRTVRYGQGPEDEEVFVPIASLRELSKAFAAFLIDRQCPSGGTCCKTISLLPLSALSIADSSSGLQRCIASFLQRPDSQVHIKFINEALNVNSSSCCPPGQCGCSASDCHCCK